MKTELNNIEKQNESLSKTEKARQNDESAYHTPKLLRYGGLAELVRNQPGRAMDGETMLADCTLT